MATPKVEYTPEQQEGYWTSVIGLINKVPDSAPPGYAESLLKAAQIIGAENPDQALRTTQRVMKEHFGSREATDAVLLALFRKVNS